MTHGSWHISSSTRVWSEVVSLSYLVEWTLSLPSKLFYKLWEFSTTALMQERKKEPLDGLKDFRNLLVYMAISLKCLNPEARLHRYTGPFISFIRCTLGRYRISCLRASLTWNPAILLHRRCEQRSSTSSMSYLRIRTYLWETHCWTTYHRVTPKQALLLWHSCV